MSHANAVSSEASSGRPAREENQKSSTVGPATSATDRGFQARCDLRHSLRGFVGAFAGIGVFSGLINALMLTGSLFMLEVYDRVLPSRSIPTLVALSVLTASLFIFQILLEITRSRLLARIGLHLDRNISPRIFELLVQLPLRTKGGGQGDPIRDLEAVRGFFASSGPSALFDLPWVPLYLLICFAFHPLIGLAALVGALVLVGLTVATELLGRAPLKAASNHGATRQRLGALALRNAEALHAMGMTAQLQARWNEITSNYLEQQRRATDIAGGFGVTGRVLRMMLQSAVLAIGAYLVIQGEATAGIIIASSILTGRALAPVDMCIASWRGFVVARQGWSRLSELLRVLPPETPKLQLPTPSQMLSVETISVTPPGSEKSVVQGVAFAVKAGSALGIIGPSASGKSTLARALVGVWRPSRGYVRLDGAVIEQWPVGSLGAHVGYLPQGVELIEGSIAENISRFEVHAPAEAVIEAARAAGVHDMIVAFPAGYETQIGHQGSALSAGQQQRIALARALYKRPFLVVLDEPNSNLDVEGEQALTDAILAVRARGGIAIVIAHRASALAAVDQVLVMKSGFQQTFGPKETVLAKVSKKESAPQALKVVPQGGN